jgi:hypothetical protein
MRTTGPTAGPAHALAHLVKPDGDTAFSSYVFLSGGDPADPLVARQRRNVRPHLSCNRVRMDCILEICRKPMYHTGGALFFRTTFC